MRVTRGVSRRWESGHRTLIGEADKIIWDLANMSRNVLESTTTVTFEYVSNLGEAMNLATLRVASYCNLLTIWDEISAPHFPLFCIIIIRHQLNQIMRSVFPKRDVFSDILRSIYGKILHLIVLCLRNT